MDTFELANWLLEVNELCDTIVGTSHSLNNDYDHWTSTKTNFDLIKYILEKELHRVQVEEIIGIEVPKESISDEECPF